jgi:asparagine synthase (glutamine-hydrolysing)
MHFARIVTKHFGARAHEHYLTPDEAADAVPRIAAFYDEPFGNSSAVPTYYCAKSARDEGVDLLVAGDGGDEIFAGNARYARQTALERNFRAVRHLPSAVVGPALGLLRGPRLAQRARNYLAFVLLPLPDRMMAGEHLAPGEASAIFAPDFYSTVDLDAPMAIAREEYARTTGGGPLHRMMHLDLRITLADNDLRKVCAMTRMAGVKVRFPFLDEDVVEFAATIPSSILLQGGELRAFYKAAMKDFLPKEVIEKKKHGFGMPYDVGCSGIPGCGRSRSTPRGTSSGGKSARTPMSMVSSSGLPSAISARRHGFGI